MGDQPFLASPAGSGPDAAIRIVKALYDYEPRDRKDLKMRKGDKIEVLEDVGGWCRVRSTSGQGIVPGNYLSSEGQ